MFEPHPGFRNLFLKGSFFFRYLQQQSTGLIYPGKNLTSMSKIEGFAEESRKSRDYKNEAFIALIRTTKVTINNYNFILILLILFYFSSKVLIMPATLFLNGGIIK